mmetsp:Transcript_34846/g.80571  ORF Transcript_34846/g.80571 Transcript_34846/m.80571 type:complete len:201 (+) Transcript_34846:514-1116(+)
MRASWRRTAATWRVERLAPPLPPSNHSASMARTEVSFRTACISTNRSGELTNIGDCGSVNGPPGGPFSNSAISNPRQASVWSSFFQGRSEGRHFRGTVSLLDGVLFPWETRPPPSPLSSFAPLASSPRTVDKTFSINLTDRSSPPSAFLEAIRMLRPSRSAAFSSFFPSSTANRFARKGIHGYRSRSANATRSKSDAAAS